MDRMERVQCTACEKRYHIYEHSIPVGAEEGEAFPSECPFCEKGTYAALVKTNLK